jgi:integrase
MPLQKVTEDHVEAFIVWLLTEARSRCGKPGTGLRPSTADVLLARFKDACRFAVRRRVLTRSPAEYASIPRMARRQDRTENPRTPWNVNEVQAFLVGIRQERLFACVLLSLMGMRPAEVAGLRWADIDLDRGTLSIANTRTSVGDVHFEKPTKTEAGTRVLPLPAPVIVALLALKVTQEAESLALGADYVNRGGYVLVDEAGVSLNTAEYRRAAYALMTKVGLRKVRLYDARASCLTFLAVNGVPDVILAAWAGHTNASFTKKFYVHPDPEDLRGAAVQLERLLELPSVSS